MESLLIAGAGGLLLAAAWLAATRRHVRRRERQEGEWEGAEDRPDLWTSAARCPRCGSRGGLLETRGDDTEFVCMACGARHVRQTRA